MYCQNMQQLQAEIAAASKLGGKDEATASNPFAGIGGTVGKDDPLSKYSDEELEVGW